MMTLFVGILPIKIEKNSLKKPQQFEAFFEWGRMYRLFHMFRNIGKDYP